MAELKNQIHLCDMDQWEEAIQGDLVVVKFGATWCQPCKALLPKWEQAASKYESVLFVSVDVDEHPELMMEMGVSSVPSMIFFEKGERRRVKLLVQKDDGRVANYQEVLQGDRMMIVEECIKSKLYQSSKLVFLE
jgi:thioredoxin 1